jgi:hypothetical protein
MLIVGRPEERRPLGRPRRRWVDNIKIDLTYLLRGLSPQANYTNRATAACRRS